MKKFLFRLIISAVVLSFLLSKIDLWDLKEVFGRFNLGVYLLAVLTVFLYQIIWAIAWKTALRQKGYILSLRDIYRTILVSHFFGTFLPTTAGPDIMLAFNIGKALPEKEHAPSSLLFIRSINIFFNLTVSGIFLLILPLNQVLKQILIITWILALTILTGFYLATHKKTQRILEKITLDRWRIFTFIRKTLSSFSIFGTHYPTLIKLAALSLGLTFLRVTVDYTVALSLGIHIPFKWFIALIPCVTIISTIPVTLGGLGIREGAYMGIFSSIGISPVNSLSISLLLFTVLFTLNIAGGITYIIRGSHIKLIK